MPPLFGVFSQGCWTFRNRVRFLTLKLGRVTSASTGAFANPNAVFAFGPRMGTSNIALFACQS